MLIPLPRPSTKRLAPIAGLTPSPPVDTAADVTLQIEPPHTDYDLQPLTVPSLDFYIERASADTRFHIR